MWDLSKLYVMGERLKEDYVQAHALFTQSMPGGYVPAKRNLRNVAFGLTSTQFAEAQKAHHCPSKSGQESWRW